MLRQTILMTALILMLAIVAAPVVAGEMLVEGRVVRVVPIHGQDQVTSRECSNPRPPATAGIADVLTWDLQLDCQVRRRTVDVVEGYRVYYEWDDRLFETVLAEAPADTIMLRVRVH